MSTRSTRIYRLWAHWAVRLGIARGSAYGPRDGVEVYYRGKRCSFLGWPRWKWRCLLRFHHWPTDYTVAFGLCGKCCPWPCCDSIERGHKPGCVEAS